jgi:hypothetical protein
MWESTVVKLMIGMGLYDSDCQHCFESIEQQGEGMRWNEQQTEFMDGMKVMPGRNIKYITLTKVETSKV